jgi:hypothetical protein
MALIDLLFLMVASLLLGVAVAAALAPAPEYPDCRRKAGRAGVFSCIGVTMALVLAAVGLPGMGMFAAAGGAAAAAVGAWLARGGRDDGEGGSEVDTDPPSPSPGTDRPEPTSGPGLDWDGFDRERAGWDRPLVGV